jgi:uncharacterized membrane protein HdeD (DUF308 family)
MSAESGGGPVVTRLADLRTVEEKWRFLAAVGGVLVVVGLASILFPLAFGAGLRLFLGGALLVGGLPMVVHAIRAGEGVREFAVELVLGLFYVGVGLVLLANLQAGLASLSAVLAFFLFVGGVLLAFLGLRLRPARRWEWPVGGGVASVLFAALLWIGWPTTEPWAVGLWLGLGLVATGVALLVVATGARPQAATEPVAASGSED